MSNVKKRDRKQSGFAVVDTADIILSKTMVLCLKMPRRYTYLILTRLIDTANDIADYCHEGNFVPKNAHEVQMRRDCFLRARGLLTSLISKVSRFLDTPEILTYKDPKTGDVKQITVSEYDEYIDLLDNELNLITGTLNSDMDRYKDLV